MSVCHSYSLTILTEVVDQRFDKARDIHSAGNGLRKEEKNPDSTSEFWTQCTTDHNCTTGLMSIT